MEPAGAETPRDAAGNLAGIDTATHATPRRYLTDDVPPIGGAIKQRPEDFVVEEIPLYDPCGEGEHAYIALRRRSLATLDVVRILTSHFRVPRKAIGYAGLKDKHAVSTQVFSVRLPTTTIDDYPHITHPRVEVLWAGRHTNKLRRGHLKGNRFTIRVRDPLEGAEANARAVLDRLAATGAPARFGPQRFGHLGRNHLVGRALVLGDCQQFLDLLLGPCDDHPGAQAEGRALYGAGRFEEAIDRFPAGLRAERVALRVLADGADARRATLAIGRVERSFFGSAMQSAIFNAVLDDRLARGELGTLLPGDIAMTHPRRAVIDADDELLADPDTARRLADLAIGPTGPMWGRALKRAGHEIDRRETDALARLGLAPGDIDRSEKGLTGPLEGSRRPLRVPLTDHAVGAGEDEHGPYVQCAFTLPRGSFATVVLEEAMKLARADTQTMTP